MTILCWRVEGFVEGFVGVLSADFLCIYIARAEYFLIPDDAVDRRQLGF